MDVSLVLLSLRHCPRKMFTPSYTSDHSCSIFTFPFPSPLFVGHVELMPKYFKDKKIPSAEYNGKHTAESLEETAALGSAQK